MKAYRGLATQLQDFLYLEPDTGGWSDLHPGSFNLCEISPGRLCIGSWVSFVAGRTAFERREIYCLCRNTNPYSLIIQPVAQSLYGLSYTNFSHRRAGKKFSVIYRKRNFITLYINTQFRPYSLLCQFIPFHSRSISQSMFFHDLPTPNILC